MAFCFVEKYIENKGSSMNYFHYHGYYEIYGLFGGDRQLYIGNDYYTLHENSIVIIPPNVPHRTEGTVYTRINVNVDDEFLDEFQKEIIHTYVGQIIKLEAEERAIIVPVLEGILRVQTDEALAQHLKDYYIKTYFAYLFVTISKLKNLPKERLLSTPNFSPLAKKTINYLNEHFTEKITLDDLSAKFFVSKVTLCKAFKKATNSTIADYLLMMRISKAKELLGSSSVRKSIGEIAEICGFSSQNYFSLIFKQKTKLSPLNYRKYQHPYIK